MGRNSNSWTKIRGSDNSRSSRQIRNHSEYDFKVEQIDDIELELHRLEKKEALQNKIKTEQEAIDIIKKELARGGDLNESRRIFRTVNVLVDLVNEKNKVTLNELNSVKAELRELQKKYVEVMSKLK